MDKNFLHILYLVIGVGFVSVLVVYLIHKLVVPIHVPLSDTNLTIVLSFIGVLATFIVIGNFAQVSDIRRQMEQDLAQKKIVIDNVKTTADDLKKELDKHTTEIETTKQRVDQLKEKTNNDIIDLKETIDYQSDYDRTIAQDKLEGESDKLQNTINNYKQLVFDTIIGSFDDIDGVQGLLIKLSKATAETTFILSETITPKKTKSATVKISSKELSFYEGEVLVSEKKIKTIDGVRITIYNLFVLYRLYCDLTAIRNKEQYSSFNLISSDNNENEENNDTEENFDATTK